MVWKLEQSAWRTERGAGRSWTPVMARLQLLPAHSRFSTTLPKASETSDRMAMTFMLTEFSLEEVETVKLATKLNKSGPLFVDLREKLRG